MCLYQLPKLLNEKAGSIDNTQQVACLSSITDERGNGNLPFSHQAARMHTKDMKGKYMPRKIGLGWKLWHPKSSRRWQALAAPRAQAGLAAAAHDLHTAFTAAQDRKCEGKNRRKLEWPQRAY
jgi:hypothetical protein